MKEPGGNQRTTEFSQTVVSPAPWATRSRLPPGARAELARAHAGVEHHPAKGGAPGSRNKRTLPAQISSAQLRSALISSDQFLCFKRRQDICPVLERATLEGRRGVAVLLSGANAPACCWSRPTPSWSGVASMLSLGRLLPVVNSHDLAIDPACGGTGMAGSSDPISRAKILKVRRCRKAMARELRHLAGSA